MVYTVTLNPAIDKTVYVDKLVFGGLNRVTECRMDPGGKGINVSKTLNSLNIPNIAIGIIAGKTGILFRELCSAQSIESKFWLSDGETRINTKIIDKKEAVTTEINEKGPEVPARILNDMLEQLSEIIKQGDIVVLTGSIPSNAEPSLYCNWATCLAGKGAKIFLDASGENLKRGLNAPIYAVKPNKSELEDFIGEEITGMEEIVAAGQKLIGSGIKTACISLGDKGFIIMEKNKAYSVHPMKVNVHSTVGAGDNMVAAMIYADIMNFSVTESAKWIAAAASAKIEKSGTDAPSQEEIKRLLSEVEIVELQMN